LPRTCRLKHVIERKIEGKIEVTGRQGRRRKKLLDDRKEKREMLEFVRGSTRLNRVQNS